MGLFSNLFGSRYERGDPRGFYDSSIQYDTCACGDPMTGSLFELDGEYAWLWFHDDDDSPAGDSCRGDA